MKTKIIFALSTFLLFNMVYSQKISADKIPATVSAAFKSKYPDVVKAKWEKENQNQYEAEFKQNKKEQSVLFDENGKWLKTEIEIHVSELPQSVLQALSKEFPGFKAEEANSVDHAKYGNCFAIEISFDEGSKVHSFSRYNFVKGAKRSNIGSYFFVSPSSFQIFEASPLTTATLSKPLAINWSYK